MDKSLESSAKKCEDLRQSVIVQRVVVENLISSRAENTEACQQAQVQSKRLNRIGVEYKDLLRDHIIKEAAAEKI